MQYQRMVDARLSDLPVRGAAAGMGMTEEGELFPLRRGLRMVTVGLNVIREKPAEIRESGNAAWVVSVRITSLT